MLKRKEIIKRITKKLLSDNNFLEQCIVILYRYQTHEEKWNRHTDVWNNVGFNKPDAKPLTKYANWIKKGNKLTKPFLSDARNRMMKYVKTQLSRIEEVIDLVVDREKIPGLVKISTNKAVLINFNSKKDVWVPKSSIHSKNDYNKSTVQDFVIEKWILKKEKII